MTLSDLASQLPGYRLSSQGDRFDVLIAAINRGWQLNVYASEGHPAVEDASFDETEEAAAVDVSLVHLTRAAV